MTSRVTKEMVKVIQADATNARGLRNVLDGEATLLLGFEFNSNARLGSTFFGQYQATINRATGACEVAVTNFYPDQMVNKPSGATHFRLIMAGGLVNFENGTFSSNLFRSAEIELNNLQAGPFNLATAIAGAATEPIFLVFGIEFFQQVNGQFYPLKNGAFNAQTIAAIDGGV